ncbi:kinase-like protein, partial [Phellopilus nigrolimitatus]
HRNSKDALRNILAKLSHLDLTGRVSPEGSMMKAHGGYCDVFIGTASSLLLGLPPPSRSVKVAIKRLRVHLMDEQNLAKHLAKEMHLWSKLQHTNVLPLVGYVLEDDYPSLISEWIENGTIVNFVKGNPHCDIDRIVLGIAKGLGYLHSKGIIHSDLKADNVLMSSLQEPLICDFGISRMLASSQTIHGCTTLGGGVKGSARWMAIELLFSPDGSDPKHSKKSDIWAYGMTVYEILAKQLPYAQFSSEPPVILAIFKGERPSKPKTLNTRSSSTFWKLCEECWDNDPNKRPTINRIITVLKHKTL